ncbi:hypothetical protein Dsin_010895 [Dipteronia sinensis]|uniref:Uncharacterized protein n=1 Tax=Dipteronia sinensis TaxID=43782 RepID=A0AAE0EEU7_9ROSI|nr:hypothetical protein Dsin_010895 [Dipteronia sinensis]
MGHAGDKEVTIFANDNGEDFFNNLPSPKADTPASTAADTSVFESRVPNAQEMHEETDGLEESSDPSFDDSVQLIAHVGGAALWESTLDRYLKMNRSPYLKVVSVMVNNDLLSLVNTRPLKFWKETLALLCTVVWNFQATLTLRLIGCDDGTARVFDMYSRKCSRIISRKMHGASVTCLSLSEDHLIISGSSLGSITISGLFSDRKVATLRSTESTGLYHMPAVKNQI